MKILMIDDDDSIIAILKFRLENAGHIVYIANNGKAGVEKALELMPDLILMDYHMPKISGDDTVKKLRSRHYRNLIVALTASAAKEDKEIMMEAGCDYFISKPVDEKFVETVENILKKG